MRRVPTKAAYETFETNPDIEFDFFLADRLRMTVAEMRATVSAEEWRYWNTYHGRIDQRRELAQKMAGA